MAIPLPAPRLAPVSPRPARECGRGRGQGVSLESSGIDRHRCGGYRKLAPVGRFDPRLGSARVWLFGIARHVLAQSARRGRVDSEARRRLGLEVLVVEREQLDAIAELIQRDGDRIVGEWLAVLPDEQAQALRARVLDGRSYEAIAAELRCSQAVVRQRVSRGLGRLRREVGKEAA